jgi:hypothetical protein
LTSGAKQKVGGKVKYCSINLGRLVAILKLFVTTLGSYDIVIGMDWLESHDTILNYKMKRLILIDDLGQNRVIVGRNQGVSLRFVTSLQLNKNMHKGYKVYDILSINKNGGTKILEDFSVVSKFAKVFLEELPIALPKRELEFTIYLT